MRRSLILIPLVLSLALLPGCGSTPRQYATRIDGASARTTDHQSAKGAGADNTTSTRLTITPASQPSPAVVPAPVSETVISPPPSSNDPAIVKVIEPVPAREPQPVKVTIEGRHIEAPGGSAITMEITGHDVQTPGETHRDRDAEGLGATIRTDAKEMTAGFTASAPDVKLSPVTGTGQSGGGSAADGGDTAANVVTQLGEAISAASKGATAMWVIAILCFLAAAGVTLFDVVIKKSFNFLLVGILAGVGILFVGLALVIEQHPTLLILGVLAAVGGFIFYVYHKNAVSTAAGTPKPVAPATAATAAAVPAPTDVSMWQEIKTEIDAALSPKSKA